jgi:hypothetical protein
MRSFSLTERATPHGAAGPLPLKSRPPRPDHRHNPAPLSPLPPHPQATEARRAFDREAERLAALDEKRRWSDRIIVSQDTQARSSGGGRGRALFEGRGGCRGGPVGRRWGFAGAPSWEGGQRLGSATSGPPPAGLMAPSHMQQNHTTTTYANTPQSTDKNEQTHTPPPGPDLEVRPQHFAC